MKKVLRKKWLKMWKAIILIFYIATILLVFYFKPEGIKLNLGINSQDLFFTLSSILIVVVLMIMLSYFGKMKLKVNFGLKRAVLSILFLSLIMAPAEEIIFRGFLGVWIANNLGVASSVLVTNIIFGVFHLPKNRKLAFYATIGGIIFSIIYFNTSSIIYPIIAHVILGFLYFFSIK